MAQITKQVKNLYKSLIKDENSIFCATDRINKKLINRAKISLYDKDQVFVKFYKESENIEEIYFDENTQPILPLTTPFIEKKRDIDRSTLYSFESLWSITCRYCWLKIFRKIWWRPKILSFSQFIYL